MRDDLRLRILDYLQRHNTMTLATCQGDEPWAAAVFYVSHDFDLYFLSDPKTTHCRHLAANPRAAATIHEDCRDWREIKGLQIEGTAEMVSDAGEIQEAWRLYVAKYPFVASWQAQLMKSPIVAGLLERAGADAAEIARRLGSVRFYKLTARRVLLTDNSRGFGHREELRPDGVVRWPVMG